MDILLHITGLAFIPIMIYILFLGAQDIISVLHDQFAPQWKRATTNKNSCNSHQIYEFTTYTKCL